MSTPDGERRPGNSATLLSVEVTERPGALIVRLAGEVDTTTVHQAAAGVDNAVDQAGKRVATVVLDLTEVTFFASVGLNLLVKLRHEVEDRQLDIRLAASASAVLRPLELMGLGELFPTYPTLDEALGAPAGQG